MEFKEEFLCINTGTKDLLYTDLHEKMLKKFKLHYWCMTILLTVI